MNLGETGLHLSLRFFPGGERMPTLARIGVLGLVFAAAATALGQTTVYVNGTTGDDGWDGLCKHWGGGTCGPKATIQAGIDAAQPGDHVVISDGTYAGAGNKDLDFGGKPITVRSASGDPAMCVIDCRGSGRGFYFHNEEGAGSVVQDLTVRNANIDTGSVYCCGASPTLTNCTIRDNTANCGGGVACSQYACPTLTNCTIRDNLAAYGAGVWCFEYSSPTLTDCTITGNANGDFGAGVDCYDSDPTLTNCTIAGNTAAYGGGALHCLHASPTLTNCTISNNFGGASGGGVYCRLDSSPTLTDCTITGNTSTNCGGGIFCQDATATLANCTVAGNTAGYGGGVDCLSSVSPMLTNCAITGNSAAYRGGGLRCYESSPTLTNCIITGNRAEGGSGGGMHCEYDSNPSLTNCTVTGNTAEAGGGLACSQYSSPTLTSCILWADTPGEIYADSGSPVVAYCDVQGGWTGEGNINADPLFVDPVGPDGVPATQDDDFRLSPGSPCIDAGDSTAVPLDVADLDGDGDTIERTPLDLWGLPRFWNDPDADDSGVADPPDYPAVVDMGAYEYHVLGDLDFDGDIDGDDYWLFVAALPSCAGDPQYNPAADLDFDGCVTLVDYQIWLLLYREANPPQPGPGPVPKPGKPGGVSGSEAHGEMGRGPGR
jgi:parallel beta-helix repeat protein